MWLSFVDEVTTWTYKFVSLIVKLILLRLTSLLSAPAAPKIIIHFSSNSTLQLINIQNLLRYLEATAAKILKIPFDLSTSVLPNNASLNLKDLKLLLFTISALKLSYSSLELTSCCVRIIRSVLQKFTHPPNQF